MNGFAAVSLAVLATVPLAASVQAHEASGRGGMLYYSSGHQVPAYLLADDNVVVNYQHYHLDRPVSGYEWVHGLEGEYLLVSTRSAILRRIEYRPTVPAEPSAAK
jgi:Ni/Co efflux regulator RcnB